MEFFDLYDIYKNKTGEILKRGDHTDRGYYLCVQVVVINSLGEILTQQRADSKPAFAGAWDLSVCGGVLMGETSQQAAARELYEELGIRHDFTGVRPILCVSFPEGYTDVYVIRQDIPLKALTLQTEEVQDARWQSPEDIIRQIEDGSFSPYYPGYIRFLSEAGGRYGSLDFPKVREDGRPGTDLFE